MEITALRRKMENGTTALTIMVVNAKTERPQSSNCIFQPELRVDSENNGFSFVQYSVNHKFRFLLMRKNNPWNSSTETSMYTEPDSERQSTGKSMIAERDSYAMTSSRSLKFRPWISRFQMIAGSTDGHYP